jgi:hypothetical protein
MRKRKMGQPETWFGVGFSLACLVACACSTTGPEQSSPPANPEQSFEQQYGFRPDGISLASAGYMLDFRFWVTDPELAWKVLGARDGGPFLLHPSTGSRLIVPSPAYVGRLAPSRQPKPNRRYFIFFANPGRLVASGDTVIVQVGGLEIGPLTVK